VLSPHAACCVPDEPTHLAVSVVTSVSTPYGGDDLPEPVARSCQDPEQLERAAGS
jgi:hypothetical protein